MTSEPTRMHSSRMRTVRSSGRISGGGIPGLGGCTWSLEGCTWSPGVYLVPEGVCAWSGGCTWSRGCTLSGGCTWSRGVCVPGLGGCTWSRGVYLVPGGYLVRYSPPCGQTDACKNITFATSLRTVNMAAESHELSGIRPKYAVIYQNSSFPLITQSWECCLHKG